MKLFIFPKKSNLKLLMKQSIFYCFKFFLLVCFLSISTTTFSQIKVNNQNNVGIGNDNPQSKLHIDGEVRISTLETESLGNPPLTNGTTKMVISDIDGKLSFADFPNNGVQGSGLSNRLAYWTSTTNQTFANSLYFDAINNRLGLGTSSPSTRLELAGIAYTNIENGGIIVDASGLKRVGLMKYFGQFPALAISSGSSLEIGNTSTSDVSTPGTFSSRMTINPNGVRFNNTAYYVGSNVTLGSENLPGNNSGSNNVVIGAYANYANTSGSDNVIIGRDAMASNTTSGCVALGHGAGYYNNTANRLYIANNISTTLIYGEFNNNRVGINKTSLSSTLHVGGDLTIDDRSGISTSIAGYTSTGKMSTLGLGTGLEISGGILNCNLTSLETWQDISGSVVNWGATGTFGSGKPIGIGVSSTTRHLDVNADVRLRGAIYTSANTSGTAGQSLKSNGSSAFYYEDNCTVQIWTTPGSYTYTKPTNAKSVYVKVIGAGGGGAGGSKAASGTLALGGAGGDGGGYSEFTYRAAELTTTSVVLVGVGGAGGAGATTNSSAGAFGSDGGDSVFKNIVAYGGRRGNPALLKYGQGIVEDGARGSYRIDASTTFIDADTRIGPSGGGGGGSISTSNTMIDKVQPSLPICFINPFVIPTITGGRGSTGGVANLSGNGTAGTSVETARFGAGGGGGGAARNSVGNGGAGAAGQGGAVMVITYY